jgi:hypothetical protein
MVSLCSAYYMTMDRLTLIVLGKLARKFLFVSAWIREFYKQTEKYFAPIAQN